MSSERWRSFHTKCVFRHVFENHGYFEEHQTAPHVVLRNNVPHEFRLADRFKYNWSVRINRHRTRSNRFHQNLPWIMGLIFEAFTSLGLVLKVTMPHSSPRRGLCFDFRIAYTSLGQDCSVEDQFLRWKTLKYTVLSAINFRSFIIDFKNFKASKIQLGISF